jgi:hypothetical protein
MNWGHARARKSWSYRNLKRKGPRVRNRIAVRKSLVEHVCRVSHVIHTMKCALRNLLALVTIVCAGCSSSGPEVVPLDGNVAFEGRKLPGSCRIMFAPNKAADGAILRPSIATMQSDGSYQVAPYHGTRGLVPGTYQVRVTYYDVKPGADAKVESSWNRKEYVAPELQIEPGSSRITHNITVPLNR